MACRSARVCAAGGPSCPAPGFVNGTSGGCPPDDLRLRIVITVGRPSLHGCMAPLLPETRGSAADGVASLLVPSGIGGSASLGKVTSLGQGAECAGLSVAAHPMTIAECSFPREPRPQTRG